MNSSSSGPVVLAHAFRAFFLLTGIYGVLVVLAWVAFIFAGLPLPLGWSPLNWHGHEMLYGLVAAAIAGFVLTAMTNWTDAKPLHGLPLLGLVSLWVAGRLAMWLAGILPAWLVAVVDGAFLPVLAGYVALVLLRHHNRRNLVLVGIIALLAAGNGLMQWGFLQGNTELLRLGQLLGFDLIAVLIVVIGGRIIPAFSANWLRNNGGNPEWVTRSALADKLALASMALLVIADGLAAPAWAVGGAAAAAGLVNGVRLWQWAGWRVVSEPLLWILHLAYLWLVIALALRGASEFTSAVPPTLWQHALGVGAIATIILGVITRVALGHTGRTMALPPFAIWIYISIIAASVFRVLAAAQWMDYRLGVTLAAIGWVQAFALFVVLYWSILTGPRADGRPG